MRRRWVLLMVAFLLLPALPVGAASDEPWVVTGGGWGHGVGLSQFGAFGQAQDGRSAEQILQFYYKGTSLDSMPGDHWSTQPNGLWVGLVSNTSSINLSAVGGQVTVCQPSPGCELAQTINPGEAWKFETNAEDSTQCRLRHVGVENTGWAECSASISDVSPSSRAVVGSQQYGRGTIRMDPSSAGFHVVATMDMETYLYGLSEVPSSWPGAALRAQAIIGRSYALATAHARGGGDGQSKLSSCGCHIRDTAADQVYAGWVKETGAYGADWKTAVDATTGDILIHPDSPYAFDVAKAFYSSSNGGASENVEDVWGGAALPWLRSTADQWSSDPAVNPLATWSVKVDDEDMAAALGWDHALDAEILEGPPGVEVRFSGLAGGVEVSTVLNGSQIASILNNYGFGYEAPGTASTAVRVSPYITNVVDPPGFDDIIDTTFEVDIEWLAQEGITKGCNPPDNTEFCPDDSITRGQMAAFLKRYLKLPAASQDYFADDNDSIFEDDINRLAEAGITKGCGGVNFCPDALVSRGQMAAFLVRAFGLKDAGAGDLFIDDNTSIFETDIDRLGTAGITKGCNPPTNNRYCPVDSVSRGAMAAFLHRASDL